MRKHGLDAASCAALNPALIHVWMPGFASADEQLDHPPPVAWEAVLLASAGVFRDMGVNRQLLGVTASYSPLPLASAYASVWAALAAAAALYRSARLGRSLGEAIEVPLASCLLETLCHNSLRLDGLPEHYLSARQRRLAAVAAAAVAADAAAAATDADADAPAAADADAPAAADTVTGGAASGCDCAAARHDFYDVQELLDPFYASYTCRDARPFYLVCPSHRAHQERAMGALGLRAELAALGLPVAQTYADVPAGAGPEDEGEAPSRHGLGAAQAGDKHAPALRKLMRGAFLLRTATEWEARMGAWGVPGAAHRATAEWLSCRHATEAGLVVPCVGAAVGAVRPCSVANPNPNPDPDPTLDPDPDPTLTLTLNPTPAPAATSTPAPTPAPTLTSTLIRCARAPSRGCSRRSSPPRILPPPPRSRPPQHQPRCSS